jgi:hypothetical protein
MDLGQRQPLQERYGAMSTEGAEGKASFYYGELSNGTINSTRKQVICDWRAVLSEFEMSDDEWPEVVNLVQSVLHNSLSTRLNKRTPMRVFTGHAEAIPLALMLKDNVPVNAHLDFSKAQYLVEVGNLSKARTEIYAQAAEKATRDRKAST